MSVISTFDRTQIDGIWNRTNSYLANFEKVSLPLGGFTLNDCNELFLLLKEQGHRTNITNIRIVEIGCWTGVSTAILSLIAEKFTGKVYAIDWFRGSGKTNLEFAGNYFNIKKICQENIGQFTEQAKRVELIEAKSLDAVRNFTDESLDVVFLDGDHRYDFIKADIEAWLPKLKSGGIMCGHDCEIILDKGIDTLHEIYKDVDMIQVVHFGVCQAVTELGGKKVREMNPNAPLESTQSGIWYYNKP